MTRAAGSRVAAGGRAGASCWRSSRCRCVAIFVDAAAGRAARRAGRGGRARRALALAAHDGGGDGADPRGRHAGGLPAGDAALPRPRGGDHADRAAAGAAAGGGRHRAARRRSARPALLGGALEDAGIQLALDDRGRRGRADVRRRAVLPAPGDRRVRGGRPGAARRLAHARRAAGAHVRARRRSRRRCPGSSPGTALALGPRARGVRRDADVRRLVPGRHPDGAAGDLRPLRHRLHGGARAVGRARRGVRRPSCSSVKLVGGRALAVLRA